MDREGDGWIDEWVMDERPAARLWEGRQRGIGPPGEGQIGVAADGGLKRTRHAGTFAGEKHLCSFQTFTTSVCHFETFYSVLEIAPLCASQPNRRQNFLGRELTCFLRCNAEEKLEIMNFYQHISLF